MPSFTVFYPEMIVHRTGCKDIAKVPNQHADTTVVDEAPSLDVFLREQLANDLGDLGYTVEDFNIKPCAATRTTAPEVGCRECGQPVVFRYIVDQTLCIDCLERLAERIEREELGQ